MNLDKLIGSVVSGSSKAKPQNSFVESKVKMHDALNNSVLGLGKSNKTEQFNKFDMSNDTLNFALWLALYNDSWIFRRAIDKPSQDMVNLPFDLITNYDVTKPLIKYNEMKSSLMELLMWGALFGGSIAIMLFDNVPLEEMSKPLNIKKIKEFKQIKLYTTDRWYGVQESIELVSDITNVDFGKPKYYTITFSNGKAYKVHHTYVLRYEHRTAPQLIKKGNLQGWGLSEGVHILRSLTRDEKLKEAITKLVDKSLIEVIKMSGMRGVFMSADAKNQEQLQKRLEMVNWGRNFNSLTFLDKDDEYQQNEFGGLSGLSDLMYKNMLDIASALDMQGILYGDMSQGFSRDNFALVRYDTTIRNRCENYFKQIMIKLFKILYLHEGIDDEVVIKYNSMIQARETDIQQEFSSFLTNISTMINDGYFTTEQAAKAVKQYTKTHEVGITISDEELEKISKNSESELDNASEFFT